MTLDLNAPVETRGGGPARILCTDANSLRPVVALITDKDGSETAIHYTKEGRAHPFVDSSVDLVNAPKERHHVAAIQRWAEDGRVICEVQSTGTLGWTKTDTPTWNPHRSYRLILNGELILTSLAKE